MTNEFLGRDIEIREGQIQFSVSQDFLPTIGETNLRQAIFTRLQTVLGEYYVEAYGSELKSIVGEQRNELLRGEIMGYISGALYQEPRIQRIVDILITYPADEISLVQIEISVIPIESNTPLNLVYPLFL